jgi:Fic family protein
MPFAGVFDFSRSFAPSRCFCRTGKVCSKPSSVSDRDGRGRIGRAIAVKAMTQSFGQQVLVSSATTILAHQRSYYEALERANRRNDITDWLVWFAEIVLEAQRRSIAQVEFIIAKTKLLDRLRGQISERQQKALLRMFREGPEGFKGGLSAGNYSTITGASPATTTRDLADLVEKGALARTGERKHARYALNLPMIAAYEKRTLQR